MRSGGYEAYCFSNQCGLGMCEDLKIHVVITQEQSWIVIDLIMKHHSPDPHLGLKSEVNFCNISKLLASIITNIANIYKFPSPAQAPESQYFNLPYLLL